MLFIVDYENVGSKGLKGIENCTEKDTIVILYTTVAAKQLQSFLSKTDTAANILTYKVETGHKEVLDVKLITYSIFALHQGETQLVYVSRDNGYLSVKNAIKEFGIKLKALIGYSHNLESIHTYCAFEDGVCKEYTIVSGKYVKFNGLSFEDVEGINYVLTDSDDYIARCYNNHQKIFSAADDERETRSCQFEMFQLNNPMPTMKAGYLQPVLKHTKEQWESMIDAVKAWCLASSDYNSYTIQAVTKLKKRVVMPKDAFLATLSTLLNKKPNDLMPMVDVWYTQYMNNEKTNKDTEECC